MDSKKNRFTHCFPLRTLLIPGLFMSFSAIAKDVAKQNISAEFGEQFVAVRILNETIPSVTSVNGTYFFNRHLLFERGYDL